MELYILDTTTQRRFWITVGIKDTIAQIKTQIAKKSGLSSNPNDSHIQQLTFMNKPLLKDNLTLIDYNIPKNSELHIHYSLNDQHPHIPLYLKMKEPLELQYICCDPQIDIETQLQCITLIASTNIHFVQSETLVSNICKQAYKDRKRLKLLQRLADKCEQYHTPFYELRNVDIIEKLNAFCDPLQHCDTLLIVSKMLRKSCEVIGKCERISLTDTLLQELNILLMYSGNEKIIENAIESYNALLTDAALAANIKQIIKYGDESKDILQIQYNAKIENDKELFEYFMKDIQSVFEIIVPKDVIELIDKYYNWHKDEEYNLMQRLMNICRVDSGYCKKIRHVTLLFVYKLTKFGNAETVSNMIYNDQVLLTVRKVLNNFKNDIEAMRVIGATLYNCVLANKYCLFSYDVLEPLIELFVRSGTSNQEPVIYILYIIKEKIPTSKMLYLMKRYPFIQNVCSFMRYHRREKDAMDRSLKTIEYFLGIQQKGIGPLCVALINQMKDDINIFQWIVNAEYDDEISLLAAGIVATYFSNK